MTLEHSKLLRKNLTNLERCMNPETVVTILYSQFKITTQDKADVLAEVAQFRKSRKLLEIVERSDDSVYDALIEALEETGQPHLANLLRCDPLPTSTPSRIPSHPVQATTSPGNISL